LLTEETYTSAKETNKQSNTHERHTHRHTEETYTSTKETYKQSNTHVKDPSGQRCIVVAHFNQKKLTKKTKSNLLCEKRTCQARKLLRNHTSVSSCPPAIHNKQNKSPPLPPPNSSHPPVPSPPPPPCLRYLAMPF